VKPNCLIRTINLPHEEWLAARRLGIGGSDAAVVVGVNKWKSPVALWLEKTGQAPDQDLSENEAVYWGNVLEDIVAAEFARRTGLKVRRRNGIFQHPEYKFMLANLDRDIIGKNEGLECKTANFFAKSDWTGDDVPDSYFLQCQHYCAVMGYDGMHIAVLLGGQQFIHKYIPRDDGVIAHLITAETIFWNHVVNNTMPAIDGSDASTEALQNLHPQSNGQIISLPDTAELWLRQYEKAKTDEDEAKTRKTEAQNVLCQMLGDSEVGLTGERKVEWKNVAGRKGFDSKRFEKDHPVLYVQYVKFGESSRRFAVK
jgi:putative phage-type endonuclease